MMVVGVKRIIGGPPEKKEVSFAFLHSLYRAAAEGGRLRGSSTNIIGGNPQSLTVGRRAAEGRPSL